MKNKLYKKSVFFCFDSWKKSRFFSLFFVRERYKKMGYLNFDIKVVQAHMCVCVFRLFLLVQSSSNYAKALEIMLDSKYRRRERSIKVCRNGLSKYLTSANLSLLLLCDIILKIDQMKFFSLENL